jgi:DNA-binding SARP family transcriptional activator
VTVLDLKFLGTPVVTWQDRPLKFATRKALALLAYLVVEPGVHARDHLAALIYPESETRLAYAGLRNTLARLREALHEQAEPLRLERDSIGFNFATAYTLDLDRVSAAVAALQAGTPATETTLAQLQGATRDARGPFLDGLTLPEAPEFDNWTAMQRAAWQRRLDLIYDHLSQQQLNAQQLGSAIETVALWINQNRLNENAYRRLMRLHFLKGDRAAALQTYEICRTLLSQELGAAPTPRTLELLAQIRLSAPPPAAHTAGVARRASFHLPLVGRVPEHQQLAQLYAAAAAGQTQVVTVAGESGMGKTRLAAEFLARAVVEGADILEGRAFETGEHLAFQPLIDALRGRLERENAPEDLLDDVWLAELAHVLPELHERYPDLPRTGHDETTARSRLFEAFARMGQALAARRPVVWLVDDVQWADADTLELLHYLARRWHEHRAPVLLILLARQEAVFQDARLRDWLATLARAAASTQLNLMRLSLPDTRLLVDALTGGQKPLDDRAGGAAALAQWLFDETHGQPFFVAETLANLDENGTLVWRGAHDAARTLDVPATLAHIRAKGQVLAPAIRDVIRARLGRTSRPAAALLGAAAVVGRNCTFARLCQVSGAGEVDALDALDELLAARLLSEAADEPRPYNIAHDRIRDVVYSELGSARQKVYHRRELDALLAEQAAPAEMAFHALAAGEWQAAFEHSLSAAKEAMKLYAVSSATYHYETARRLLNEQRAQADAATRQRLYLELGKAFEIEFHQLYALAVYQEMQALAVAQGERAMELAALVASCNVRSMPFDAHDVGQAALLAAQALPLARGLGDLQAEAQIETSLAMLHLAGDRRAAPALPHVENAARLARLAGAAEPLGFALMSLGTLRIARGEIEQAAEAWQEAQDLYRREGNRPRLQDAIHVFGMLALSAGEFERALAYLAEAYAANEALDNATERTSIAATRTAIYLMRCEYARVLEELAPLRDLDESRIASQWLINVRQQLAWSYYELGAYDTAQEQCRRALGYADVGQPFLHLPTLTLLTLSHVARGELGQAAQTAAQGAAIFDREGMLYPDWWEALPFPLAQGELALAQGDIAQAASCAEYLWEKSVTLRLRHLLPSVLFFRARIALAQGDKAAATRELEQARQLCDEMGARRDLWGICWALAQLEAERGNAETAERLKNQARAAIAFAAEQIGAPGMRATFLARADVQSVMQ